MDLEMTVGAEQHKVGEVVEGFPLEILIAQLAGRIDVVDVQAPTTSVVAAHHAFATETVVDGLPANSPVLPFTLLERQHSGLTASSPCVIAEIRRMLRAVCAKPVSSPDHLRPSRARRAAHMPTRFGVEVQLTVFAAALRHECNLNIRQVSAKRALGTWKTFGAISA